MERNGSLATCSLSRGMSLPLIRVRGGKGRGREGCTGGGGEGGGRGGREGGRVGG